MSDKVKYFNKDYDKNLLTEINDVEFNIRLSTFDREQFFVERSVNLEYYTLTCNTDHDREMIDLLNTYEYITIIHQDSVRDLYMCCN